MGCQHQAGSECVTIESQPNVGGNRGLILSLFSISVAWFSVGFAAANISRDWLDAQARRPIIQAPAPKSEVRQWFDEAVKLDRIRSQERLRLHDRWIELLDPAAESGGPAGNPARHEAHSGPQPAIGTAVEF